MKQKQKQNKISFRDMMKNKKLGEFGKEDEEQINKPVVEEDDE
jgi:hypothetical protein